MYLTADDTNPICSGLNNIQNSGKGIVRVSLILTPTDPLMAHTELNSYYADKPCNTYIEHL